jgi:DNA polymerase-3 subunit beta
MKFVVLSSDILSHLQAIGRVINNKNTMPILENFLFNVEEGKLTMTASDGDTTMVTSVQISETEGSGSFVVPVKTLLEPLKELPQQPLKFEINDENLEIFIYFQNGKYNFIANSATEYPSAKPLKDEARSLTLPSATLLGGISRTLFATAEDELRPVMNGIYFDIKQDSIVFVASDSKKLVRLSSHTVAPGFEAAFILPKKPANLLKGIISKEMGDAVINFDDKLAKISVGDFEISCRLIEGRYPKYESVIPKNNTNKLVIDRQLFTNILRRVSVFSNPATGLVKLALDVNKMVVTAQDIDYSTSAEESIGCDYNGAAMQIGFRSNFLIEILNYISSTEVEIQLADPARAGLIVPVENAEGEDLLCLLMPMMLADF